MLFRRLTSTVDLKRGRLRALGNKVQVTIATIAPCVKRDTSKTLKEELFHIVFLFHNI